jgi:hypothetical protein
MIKRESSIWCYPDTSAMCVKGMLDHWMYIHVSGLVLTQASYRYAVPITVHVNTYPVGPKQTSIVAKVLQSYV